MPQTNTITNRAAAAVSALALSFLLISGTVATPAVPQSGAAYVGVVA